MYENYRLNILYVCNKNIDSKISKFLNDESIKFFHDTDFSKILNVYNENNIDLLIVDLNEVEFDIETFISKLHHNISNQNVICVLPSSYNKLNEIINIINIDFLISPFVIDILKDKFKIVQKRLTMEKELKEQNQIARKLAHTWRQPLSIISSSASSILVQKEFGKYNEDSLIKSLELITKTAQELSVTIETFSKSKK